MNKDLIILLEAAKQKVLLAVSLVKASLDELEEFDIDKKYTPKELEPYDALSDRFIRAVETTIKFFKSYEYYLYTFSSDTYRDLLLNMEKQRIISSVEIWVDMRDIRNRIVHDYLPQQTKNIYDLIMGEFKNELIAVNEKVMAIRAEKG